MDLDNIEEYDGTHDFGTNSFSVFDSFHSDTEMSFEVDPGVYPPSDKPIHDEDMIDADVEDEYMAREMEKIKSGPKPSLVCSNLSGSSYEILVHKRVNHSFAIPNAKCLDIDPSILSQYIHHVQPKSNSEIIEQDLDDSTGLQLAACKFLGHRRPDMSSARGASEESRIYHKAVRVKRGSRYQSHITSMKVMQKELGSEFLYNTILKMSENEELGLDGFSRIKLKQEMGIANWHRRHQG
ncbi:hypothetical protein FPSE_01956 [Fusarium pseudograminearum CS3096]|uniref:Uncharacterized protein n=1 Tax=Fusarium pseudograminearum (strain CS3096) TaxID=1028729 RepID=K3VUJ4_FUSPC|nr:hypothetical protein FPSE_01956 [Fusarium pseudograminearum CS3096]EKJ77863.1 hypothetical protein FPSE_01956 [Fusarium pseudograminearum CS3096]KAF0638373.1 hypothetical protein FPSE5266_01956 [Fusarium pseudograminearum]